MAKAVISIEKSHIFGDFAKLTLVSLYTSQGSLFVKSVVRDVFLVSCLT